MSSTTPSATRKSASLARLQVENGRSWSSGRDSASLLDLAPLGQGEGGRPATGIARIQRVEPVQVEVVQHVADPVGAGEGHLGDHRDVHALGAEQHHLRPPPGHHRPAELRRTIRSSRLPSSLVISRTRTRSATLPPSTTRCRRESPPGCRRACDQLFQPTGPTLPAAGTSRRTGAARLCPGGARPGAGVDRGRRAWRQAAAEIEEYRRTYQITDPERALGPEPPDPAQRADRQRARTAIERVHTKQRAADRTHQRQPTSERTSQPRPGEQRGRQGPERAAG